MNYREYQKQTMIECLDDAHRVIRNYTQSTSYTYEMVISVANAMFALRCKHAHYYNEEKTYTVSELRKLHKKGMAHDDIEVEEFLNSLEGEIKKEFKDTKGMTTDELALEGEKQDDKDYQIN